MSSRFHAYDYFVQLFPKKTVHLSMCDLKQLYHNNIYSPLNDAHF